MGHWDNGTLDDEQWDIGPAELCRGTMDNGAMDAGTLDTRTIGPWDNENGTVGLENRTVGAGTMGQCGERAMDYGTMQSRTMPRIICPRFMNDRASVV